MGIISKPFALFLTLTLTISSLALLISQPVDAQTSQPPIPTFTLTHVKSFYNQTTTNPFNGTQITQQIDNSSVLVSIKNEEWTFEGSSMFIWYNLRYKGYFEENWVSFDKYYNIPFGSQIPPSDSGYSVVSFPIADYPSNTLLDFSVQSVAWNSSVVEIYDGYLPGVEPGNSHFETVYSQIATSDWSNTQTITLSDESVSPSPSVPEFPVQLILPLFVIIPLIVVIILRKRRCHD